ncbi:MAG TPA: ABC transporter ATP-binding protein [Clostridiaceae bacterium]|nr:ABC transporter ATP-binding protein [Clostridiaceae bacterium]
MSMLVVKNLTVRYGNLTVVEDISFSLDKGRWLMIVGPNGAGKSTIAKAITRDINYSGQVLWYGTDVQSMKPHKLARKIGMLAQNHRMGYSFTVEEVVRLGRYSYAPHIFAKRDKDETALVEKALLKTGMQDLRRQSILTLSGGELQRTFLAQLIAQDPELLILDEPTNHLDLVYQKQMFELIRQWIHDTDRSVISVVHDLSLARAYGTDALLINQGQLVDVGSAQDVLSRANLKDVYSMDVFAWMHSMLSQWQD